MDETLWVACYRCSKINLVVLEKVIETLVRYSQDTDRYDEEPYDENDYGVITFRCSDCGADADSRRSTYMVKIGSEYSRDEKIVSLMIQQLTNAFNANY